MSFRMPRPHALRKALRALNLLLLLGSLALGAHYVFVVRPATAAPAMLDVRADATPSAWDPAPPVSRSDLQAMWLDRPWPFAGPLRSASAATSDPGRPAPTDLADLGDVLAVMDGPPGYAQVLFRFPGRPARWFGVGEVVRADPGGPARFRLRDVVRVDRARYHIRYADLAAGEDRVATIVFDGQPTPLRRGGIRLSDSERAGRAPPLERRAPFAPPVVDAPAVTLDACRPRLRGDGPGRKTLLLDRNTRAWLRAHGARVLAEEVKLSPVRDPEDAGVIGIRPIFRRPEIAEVFRFRRGDILVSVDDRPIRSREDLLALARELDVDRPVTVVIDRRGRRITYVVDPRDPHVRRDARNLLPSRGSR
jgi:hypothetical protein